MAARALAPTDVQHFDSAAEFRAWLDAHGGRVSELWVGFHTKASGRGGLTYSDAVDEALCAGWIDGVRVKPEPDTYANRFSPRKPRSAWSAVNLRRFETLRALGRVAPAGLRAFEARDLDASGYSLAERPTALDPAVEAALRAEPAAWAYFEAQPPAYRRDAAFWVTSAKRDETRERRLATLVADSAAGRRFGPYEAAAARARATREGR